VAALDNLVIGRFQQPGRAMRSARRCAIAARRILFRGFMDELPQARTDAVVSEWVEGELVLYDSISHEAHCLAASVAAIWACCDGSRTATEIARELAIDTERVLEGLDELREAGLLVTATPVRPGISRRTAAKHFARVGAAAVSAPLIYSIVIPSAQAATSNDPCLIDGGSAPLCPASDNPCYTVTCEVQGNGRGECMTTDYACPDGYRCVPNGQAFEPVCVPQI